MAGHPRANLRDLEAGGALQVSGPARFARDVEISAARLLVGTGGGVPSLVLGEADDPGRVSYWPPTARLELSETYVAAPAFADELALVRPHPTDGDLVLTPAVVTATEALLVARGSGALVDGEARVELPQVFALAVDPGQPLTVQVTLTDDAKGLYVSEKAADRFVVRELQHGHSDATFDWVVLGTSAGMADWTVVRPDTFHHSGGGGAPPAPAPPPEVIVTPAE